MRGISWFVHILRDRSKLLRLKLTKLFPNINFSGEKDSGKVLIIIIILFLIIIIFLVPSSLQIQLSSEFTDGDFVDISVSCCGARQVKERNASVEVEENDDGDADEQTAKLFSCPVDGCVKLF